MKQLPIGIQTFEKIVEGNYLYIDKTKYLYDLVTQGTTYFLSRPRRFGKSLTLSTLDAILQGKKELFKGLWIYESDYEWNKYPVIRVDMSLVNRDNAPLLTRDIKERIREIGHEYQIEIGREETLERSFMLLIRGLAEREKKKVVILIDEYDKAILDCIEDADRVRANRDVLRSFYGVMKGQDAYIRFIFLTGVTKFAQVSVFSGLNNLLDITMSDRYATMLGYTQEELEHYFEEHIHTFIEQKGISRKRLLDDIRTWYNGFRFSKSNETTVYNPYSTLLLFKQQDFRNYWFETATPDFLVNLIKTQKYDLSDIEQAPLSEENISTFDIDNLNMPALLLQTGYVTIKSYNKEERSYTLGYPNKEIEVAFTRNIVSMQMGQDKGRVDSELIYLRRELEKGDFDAFFKRLKSFIASMPYTIRGKDEEKHYQSMVYTILRCLDVYIDVEVTTNKGRIDAVIELSKKIVLIEFKLRGSAQSALKQMKEKTYYEKYLMKNKPITLLGVVIDRKKKNIGAWKAEDVK